MPSLFSDTLKRYKLCCLILEKAQLPTAEQIIDAFLARDAVQAQLEESDQPATNLLDLEEQDTGSNLRREKQRR